MSKDSATLLLQPKKKGGPSGPPLTSTSSLIYLPNTTQSCSEVPINSNIGSNIHALVREAMNAWRANSGGAAGPSPAVAAIILLLLGQIIPQTFNNMPIPYAPPKPIE